MKTPQQTIEERRAAALRDKEARDRKEIACRNLASSDHFKEYCIELKNEAKTALESAVKEASKPAETRNNQRVVDLIQEYRIKENAASRVFDHIADIEKVTAQKEAP